MRISRGLLDAIRAEARAADNRECCGLLLGPDGDGPIDAIRPAANVAAEPTHRFEIDPAILLAAHRAQRSGGPALLGYYHSHPLGDARPSREDAAQAEPGGQFWLICGADGQALLWRAVAQGALHGRFDPVEMIVTPG